MGWLQRGYRPSRPDPVQVERYLHDKELSNARDGMTGFESRRPCHCGATKVVMGANRRGTVWYRCEAAHDTFEVR